MEKQDEKPSFIYINRIRWGKQRTFLPPGKNSVKNGRLSKPQAIYPKMSRRRGGSSEY